MCCQFLYVIYYVLFRLIIANKKTISYGLLYGIGFHHVSAMNSNVSHVFGDLHN